MRFQGQGPQGFPGMQGPGGMQSPMNPMQKQGVQMPGPMPMPKPGAGAGQQGPQGIPPALQAMEANNQQMMSRWAELQRTQDELRRAQVMGADPYTISDLQARLQGLMQQNQFDTQNRMARGQRQFNDVTTGNSAPGVGRGASGGLNNPGYIGASREFGIDQQLLAALLGGAGSRMPGRG